MILEQKIQKAVDALLVRLRSTIESDIRLMVHELSTGSAARGGTQLSADDRSTRTRRILDERQQSMATVLSRLLDSIRRLDAQSTLSATLDALTELVNSESGRVAVFVQRKNELRGWRFVGFSTAVGDASSHVLTGSDAGIVGQAISTRRVCSLLADSARAAEDRPPSFVTLPAERNAIAVPVLVGGEAMVVVYADDVSADGPLSLTEWSDVVELLARHAGQRLEVLTGERAAALASGVMPDGLDGTVERASDARGITSADDMEVRLVPDGYAVPVHDHAGTRQRTFVQRAVMGLLHVALFFVVALYPPYQMATFVVDSEVHYTFLGAVVMMLVLYFGVSKVFFKNA